MLIGFRSPLLDNRAIIASVENPAAIFEAGEPARRVTVPGLPGFEPAEGVTPAIINGQQRIMIVSDDGSRQENRHARYLLPDPAQLKIAP